MIEANRFKLGLFVIIGFFLFIAALFFLGMSEIFQKKARIVTLFQESVQGLDVGSAVKYKGVPIGKVTRISIRTKDKLIRVDMEIRLNAFDTNNEVESVGEAYHFFYGYFRKEIKNGLKCQLNYAGITGLKYIEIDYFKSSINEIKNPPKLSGDSFYLPSTPSIFKDILRLINKSLDKISRIPFDELSDELAETFKSAKDLLSDPKITRTIAKLEKASDHLESSIATVNKAMTERKIKTIINDLIKSISSINQLATQAEDALKQAEIPQTSARFRDASNAVSETKRSLTNTLEKLDQTLDAITELVNSIDNDPSSIIRGKRTKETMNKVIELEDKRKENK